MTPQEANGERRAIRPGTTFPDTEGRVAQLHGIGVLRIGERFFAWGEDKSAGSTFTAVACYSSPDLVDWTFEGNALEPDGADLGPDMVVERPKVLQRPDGMFVLLFHLDTVDYSLAQLGFAVSSSPTGPFAFVRSERPLGNPSRDIGVYQEGEVGYLLSEDRDHGLHIYRLAEDYLSVESLVATTLKDDGSHGYESPALIKHENRYLLFGSDLTGWSTNDNKVSSAAALSGPWSSWSDIAPPGSATFDSQISCVLPLGDAGSTSFMYIGDRWNRDDLFGSPAVWLPLEVADDGAQIHWRDAWRPELGVL